MLDSPKRLGYSLFMNNTNTATEKREGVRPSTYSTEILLAAVSRMRMNDSDRAALVKQVTERNPSACFFVVGFIVRESKAVK